MGERRRGRVGERRRGREGAVFDTHGMLAANGHTYTYTVRDDSKLLCTRTTSEACCEAT